LYNENRQIHKRISGNRSAQQHLKKACRMSSFIKRFPFVRAVMLSGSISKNYMDKSSDIDYFIITATNRLWVCRLFFVLFQKLVLFNRYKYFCYNYMIDENHLAITDKSFYTAIETTTVVPVYNYNLYQHFRESNLWTQAFFPNFPLAEKSLLSNKQSFIQKAGEVLFNNAMGDAFDKWLMKKTEIKWRKQHLTEMFGIKNLQLKRYAAKAHTEGHYNRIMSQFDEKQRAYEKKYNIIFKQPKNLLTSLKPNA
jgi:predicted nucleotidyltransferase